MIVIPGRKELRDSFILIGTTSNIEDDGNESPIISDPRSIMISPTRYARDRF